MGSDRSQSLHVRTYSFVGFDLIVGKAVNQLMHGVRCVVRKVRCRQVSDVRPVFVEIVLSLLA